ncbi:MAG: hypothetical protein HQK52_21635 [Oligoflexia bacterium]|nr:hypothetical protein [Oligoflexia bacterium]
MKKSIRNFVLLSINVMLLSLLLASCGDDTAAPAAASTTSTSATETKLSTVESSLVPSSLTYSSSFTDARGDVADPQVEADSAGPCTGYSYMGCQPVLLRMYMNMTKTFMRVTRLVLNKVGTEMGTVADGSSATETLSDSATLTYSKTDANNYSILLKDANGTPAMYLSLASGVVTLKTSLQYLPTSIRDSMGTDAPTTNEKIQVTLTYTDENNWNIDSRVVGMACETDDVAAPSTIIIKVAKSSGVWQGKAMMYHPRWIGSSNTCSTTPSDTTATCIYSDFVANNSAAKANVYMLARDVSTISSTYIINKWCDNYAATLYGGNTSSCTGLFSNNGTGSASDYVSPFCMDPNSGSPVATWNSTCSSLSSTISAADFGASSDWIAPSSIYSVDITIPSSL